MKLIPLLFLLILITGCINGEPLIKKEEVIICQNTTITEYINKTETVIEYINTTDTSCKAVREYNQELIRRIKFLEGEQDEMNVTLELEDCQDDLDDCEDDCADDCIDYLDDCEDDLEDCNEDLNQTIEDCDVD